MVSRSHIRCAFALAILIAGAGIHADEAQDRRAQTGARLFRSLLTADLDLAKKTVDRNQLLIVFYYVDDKRRAADLAARFVGDSKDIKELPVLVEVTNDPALAQYASRVPCGIFLADAPPNRALQAIIQYGIQHHTIVYSPFEGHVEKGVLAGLSVEAQVRPYVNMTTLAASNISLKPFFLHVMKAYQ
jgi:hypothetical protein